MLTICCAPTINMALFALRQHFMWTESKKYIFLLTIHLWGNTQPLVYATPREFRQSDPNYAGMEQDWHVHQPNAMR
jgi:hypothetical protein